MQAALALAEAGQTVTLAERSPSLGGQLKLAMKPPGKDEIRPFLEYLIRRIEQSPVRIQLNTDVNLEYLRANRFQSVILATGASPLVIPIPGIDSPLVCTAWDILSEKTDPKKKVLLVGAGSVGIETALFMASQGSDVTVVEITDTLLPTEVITLKPHLEKEIETYGIKVLLQHALTKISENQAVVRDLISNDCTTMSIDQVVLAVGAKPDKSLSTLLDGLEIPYTSIGDCRGTCVGLIGDAVRDGFFLPLT